MFHFYYKVLWPLFLGYGADFSDFSNAWVKKCHNKVIFYFVGFESTWNRNRVIFGCSGELNSKLHQPNFMSTWFSIMVGFLFHQKFFINSTWDVLVNNVHFLEEISLSFFFLKLLFIWKFPKQQEVKVHEESRFCQSCLIILNWIVSIYYVKYILNMIFLVIGSDEDNFNFSVLQALPQLSYLKINGLICCQPLLWT